ncbi:hypothetical protein C922_03420 [Plasmodium inui San Antonio 1]|uniref:Unconventional myosin-Va/b domain-containing protein n=1 Tax=Plasmodium inui San Antonio 1 TaxID=1237626 RepID=W7A3J7_9APIC|nr:hypothetical protein C922_03420 [Plasmodium inui San Antonio 1]EUD66225.1 hypothetical protein C922_03420 [Plasmodium inui San Antonio 1]
MAQADANNLHHYSRGTITEDNADLLNQWSDNKRSSRTSLKNMRKASSCPVKLKKIDVNGEEANAVEVQAGGTTNFAAPFCAEQSNTQRRRRSTHLVEQTPEFFCDNEVGDQTAGSVRDVQMGKPDGMDASRRERQSNQGGGNAKKPVTMKLADSHVLSRLTRTLLQGIQNKVEEERKEAKREVKTKHSGEEKPKCRGRSSSAMREQNLWSAKDDLGGESPTGGLPNGAKWTTLNSGSQGIVFQRKHRPSHVSPVPMEHSVMSGKTATIATPVTPQIVPQMASQIPSQLTTQITPETEQTFYVYQTEGQIPGPCERNDPLGLTQQEGNRHSVSNKSVCFVDEGRQSSGTYVDSSQAEHVYHQESLNGRMDPYLAQEPLIVDSNGYVVGRGNDGMVGVLKRPDEMAFHFVDAGGVCSGASASCVGSVDMGDYAVQQAIASQAVDVNWSGDPHNSGDLNYGGHLQGSGHPNCGSHIQHSGHPNYGVQPDYGIEPNYSSHHHYASYDMTEAPAATAIRISTDAHPKPSPHYPPKQSCHVPPAATSAKKDFFCNSSVKNKQLQGKKQWRGDKTEILIYPDASTKGGSGLMNGPKKYPLDRREPPFLLSSRSNATMRPLSSNVFIRTKSLHRQSEGGKNKRKGSVSPLNKFSLGRQKSVPVRTHSRNATSSTPVCTQEITYSFPSQGGCIPGMVGDQRVIKAFASTLPHGTHHSGVVIGQQSNSDDIYRNQFNDDVRSYINECSPEVISRVTDVGSPLSDQINTLNCKIGRLTSRIRSLNAEKWNLSDLARLYKNECNRLREVIAKNKQVHYDPVNFRKVNYEQANEQLEEENEKLRNQMKALGKAILSSYDINGIKKILAKQIVNLNEENEKYRQEIKVLKNQKDVNREVLFNLSRGDVSTDAIDSVFMQTKNIVIEGHQTINVFYLNLKNLIDELFQRIKFLLLEKEYTPNEKLLYVTSLEELVNENFEEINHIVVKINELRKKMKEVKAHIFDTDRSNPNCSCKPSRIILEDDINHLEEELHSHSIMLKNLRKKNLALCLDSLHSQFGHDSKGDAPLGGAVRDHHRTDKHRNSNKEKSLHRREERKDSQAVRDKPPTILDKKEANLEENPGESYHNRLQEKIRVIEHQLHTLNDHINSSFRDGDKEHRREDAIPLESQFCRNRNGDAQPGCAELDGLTNEYTTKGKQKITDKRHGKGESSYTSSSARSSVSDQSASAPSENKNWLSEEEQEEDDGTASSNYEKNDILVSGSAQRGGCIGPALFTRMLLKGKHNAELVEDTKSYVSSFGEHKPKNKYNLQKIYDNLKAIRNTIKNTEDDTERNILALIESQANEIKIFGNYRQVPIRRIKLKNIVISSDLYNTKEHQKMGKYNLIFKKNWFAKRIFGTVGIIVVLDQLARYQYNIPEIRDPNLTMWPWWLEKVAAKRLEIDQGDYATDKAGKSE